jgi:hypothetical protein
METLIAILIGGPLDGEEMRVSVGIDKILIPQLATAAMYEHIYRRPVYRATVQDQKTGKVTANFYYDGCQRA